MTVRYEGAGVRDVAWSIVGAGDEIGDDEVPEGQVALVINYDEVFYLVGTVAEVQDLLTSAQAMLRRYEEE